MTYALALITARERARILAGRAERLWRDYPREVLAVSLLLAAAVALVIGSALAGRAARADADARASTAPPTPPPMIVRALPPDQALALNSRIPLAAGPNPAARPFSLRGSSADFSRALECLTSAVYYEAGSQDADGQRAVAQVVLNRVRHPAFPASVCAVVYQGSTRATGCQFTFTCDGSLLRGADADGWTRARKVAEAALKGYVFGPVGLATHYHAAYVVPYWAPTLLKSAIVGAHIFYRWTGGWGMPGAFTQRYSAREPPVALLRSAALAAEAAERRSAPAEVAEAIESIPGAEALPLTPSMRGDTRVAIRFNLAARKAADEATRNGYVERMNPSDTLRWSLSGSIVDEQEKPLGKRDPALSPVGASGSADK